MSKVTKLPSFRKWLKAGVVGVLYSCISIVYVFTYHLPLRVLLLPEGGDLRYY
ncbi:hypothetical protein [Bacteroides thetaiotaomicron]|uniref:hypothetical protein n=1 Tax=Bacteroides thetaiotaomicron TaxID=818 RepID=UPI001F46F2F8|nr:hypothetical protein [Bacteroides thetaiotaomicron]MCE8491570.1 hypothetical protein [Bacteroides thetaiotaomicron]